MRKYFIPFLFFAPITSAQFPKSDTRLVLQVPSSSSLSEKIASFLKSEDKIDSRLTIKNNLVFDGTQLSSFFTGRSTSDSINFVFPYFNSIAQLSTEPLIFSGFTNRNETIYNGKNIQGFLLEQNVLTSDNGFFFPLRSTLASSTLNTKVSATMGNGASITERGIYQQQWAGSNNIYWAILTAPTESKPVTFSLQTSANASENNSSGAFIIKTADGNSLSMATNGRFGTIGWNKAEGTSLSITAELIRLNSEITETSILKTKSLFVSQGEIPGLNISTSILGYFSSADSSRTGLIINNTGTATSSAAGIYFDQANTSNWIGTLSSYNNSNLSLLGPLMLESRGSGGILFSASQNNLGKSGEIHFVINNEEVGRFTGSSVIVGNGPELSSSILTIHSTSKGVVLPILTTDQILEIKNPTEGLFLYNSSTKGLCIYNGINWQQVSSKQLKRKKTLSNNNL